MNMKTLLALGTLLGVSLAALIHPPAKPPAGALDLLEVTGVVSALRLDMDGTLYIRLRRTDSAGASEGEGSEQAIWFRSPPDRSAVIDVEEMLLAVVVDLDPGETITLAAERGRSLGGSPESAYPVLRLARPGHGE